MKKIFFASIVGGLLALAAITPARGFDGMDVPSVVRMAEAGDADAQSKLGVLYSGGVGMKMDKREAVKWYRKSAEQGNPVGLWNLAFMYVKGEGVAADFAEARRLFRLSAKKGFPDAQYDLGMMLLQGLGGPEDRTEAEDLFRRAAAKGNREGRKMLAELERK